MAEMVFILDEGGIFDASVEKIWKLFSSNSNEHEHPSMKNLRVERTEGAVFLLWDTEWKKSMSSHKAKFTAYRPLGFALDYVEGPFSASREFEYYVPRGPNRTEVISAGEWKSPTLAEDELKEAVTFFLKTWFEEDEKNLAKIK